MFSLVYKSKALPSFDMNAIEKMLSTARKANEKQNITGCLLYHEGWFIQLIEGEESVVKSLFKTIRRDGRHECLTLLSMEESVSRIFGRWHMVFQQISNEDLISESPSIKRQLFDDIFHTSNAVSTPGSSKLVLWIQVNNLLSEKNVDLNIPRRNI